MLHIEGIKSGANKGSEVAHTELWICNSGKLMSRHMTPPVHYVAAYSLIRLVMQTQPLGASAELNRTCRLRARACPSIGERASRGPHSRRLRPWLRSGLCQAGGTTDKQPGPVGSLRVRTMSMQWMMPWHRTPWTTTPRTAAYGTVLTTRNNVLRLGLRSVCRSVRDKGI